MLFQNLVFLYLIYQIFNKVNSCMINKIKFKKVIFLLPGPYIYEDRCQTYIKNSSLFSYREPIEEMFAAAILEKKGVLCKIIHAEPERKTAEMIIQEIFNFKPDIVIISTSYASYIEDLSYTTKIKKISSSIMTVARGGQMMFVNKKKILKRFISLDMIIYGEIESVLNILCRKKVLNETPGIIFRAKNRIIETFPLKKLCDMNELPLPSRHLLKSEIYSSPGNGLPMATIVTSRGCPNTCSFCLAPSVMGSKFRLRNVDNIILEIQECINTYNINDFLLYGDTFSLSREWLCNLCQTLSTELPGIRWVCNARADTLDNEIVRLMKTAGCWGISIGAESANLNTLQKINKKHSVYDIINAVNSCKNNGIISMLYFLIGFPWETQNEIKETIRFAIKSQSIVEIFFPYPFPGTDLYLDALNKGLTNDDCPPKYPQQTPIFVPTGMSHKKLLKLRMIARLSNLLKIKTALLFFKQCKSFKMQINTIKNIFSTIFKAYI